MSDNLDLTMMFKAGNKPKKMTPREVIAYVKSALDEKGYNALNQIVGYLLSGDPTYITNHKDARNMITQYERDELLEEIVKDYMERNL
ncbi:IreB family regulatory phosphoprotein [Criibacterium bergeronii]|uniref:UPF0297 protein BBG48_003450 n=1 Tax=Criibacterium bergeronii TaxID=1871336 RepID=A0A371IMC1_9FIRM|nr:IreB family regulatory phosphoprotein [Criibacterium bergeronii]MBS6062299.1 IreB family regulatory phosphoprotein [Peptostreptococcaceae bacterium]RDY21649.1 IreB family regulatory phosphoprotein [Criibacterium bergeronii]TRW28558.1 IreB family regulatory phosphoprotein [Criibacterium bergeronii]